MGVEGRKSHQGLGNSAPGPLQCVRELACACSESAVQGGKPENGDGQMVWGRDQGRGGHWFRGRLWWSEDS